MKYSAAHSFYWSIVCSSLGFASIFLLSEHFSNSQIGLVLALANIFAVLLQPAVAAFADRTRKISMKNLIVVLTGAAGALAAARSFLSGSFFILAVLLTLESAVLYTLQPLVNSLGMQFINKGIGINFGLARGMGSISYAVLSVLLGILVDSFGTGLLPVISTGLYLALGIVIYTFTKERSADTESDTACPENMETSEPKKADAHPFSFFMQNKKFAALMIAVSLTFCSHTMINNYLIQITENVGGTAKEMGIATGIAAAIELPAMVLFGFLVKKIRCSSILKFSLVFFTVKAALTMLAADVRTLYAAQIFQFGSYALFIPASVYYVNEIIRKEDLAKGQAFMTSAITLGGVAASLLGGLLLDLSGVRGMIFAGLIATALGLIIGFYGIEKVEVKECQSEEASSSSVS
ncbi:MFS transporter [Caproiciproducens sp.]